MPRKSMKDESAAYIQQFFTEAKAGLLNDITKTKQMPRRRALLAELDALDKVNARFYHWAQNGVAA